MNGEKNKPTGYARFIVLQEEIKTLKKELADKQSLEKKLVTLSKYSKRYEVSVQMWPKHWAVYIAKDGIDLDSFGGEPEETIQRAIDYLNRINKVATDSPS